MGRIRREGERSLSYDDSHIHTQGTGCLITSIRYGRLENTPETCPRFPSPNPDISSESLREFGVCPSFFRWFPCKKGGESFALRARVSIFRFSDGWHQVTSPGPFVRHYEIYESLDAITHSSSSPHFKLSRNAERWMVMMWMWILLLFDFDFGPRSYATKSV